MLNSFLISDSEGVTVAVRSECAPAFSKMAEFAPGGRYIDRPGAAVVPEGQVHDGDVSQQK